MPIIFSSRCTKNHLFTGDYKLEGGEGVFRAFGLLFALVQPADLLVDFVKTPQKLGRRLVDK